MKTNRRNMLKLFGTAAVAAGLAPLVSPSEAAGRKHMFDQVDIGGLTLKNRIVRAPTSMEMADEDGNPTSAVLKVYEEVAKGGSALVITGVAYVYKPDQHRKESLGLHDDSQIPAFRELADVIRRNGALSSLQIGFGGSMSGYKTDEREIWGPSAVEHPWTKITPKEMTKEDIQTVVETMAAAARRTKEAGFDSVELHFCHSFLINQFLNPFFNRRTDEYGGSIENRCRLPFDVTEAVRKAVGPDYPVLAKIMGQDYSDPGQTLKEGIYLTEGLAKRGLTAVEISGGQPVRPDVHEDATLQGYFEKDAVALGKSLDIPLILTGGNRTVKAMEAALNAEGDIAAMGLSRAILSEPDLPNRLRKDPSYDPQCIACNECIANYGQQPTVCVLNV